MNTIIVTLYGKDNSFHEDLEVPVDQQGAGLTADVFEVIENVYPDQHLDPMYRGIYLNRQGRLLNDRETLAQAGVRNGDYLTIVGK